MTALMTIGDFSRAVRLSAKALRFYHRNGLLAPRSVDAHTGYRLYAPEQIADAQIIRTLRRLDVPIDAIRAVLNAPSIDGRAALLAEHLERMERKLDETRAAVQSLRGMLEEPDAPIEIVHRSVPETRVAAIRDTIALPELGAWFRGSILELRRIAESAAPGEIGPFGGVWYAELFEEEHGEAMVYLTVSEAFPARRVAGRAHVLDLPAVELAVATHSGPDETVPRVYAALGEYVARHELSVEGPVRETYLEGFPAIDERSVTEIGWPIFRISR
ncbi:MerR family transcriptional regulator [Planctomonas deserti]|uniref:MerR family transcriptional regulator n=1 Tax=Planctomonas deserti TaxID=2144185 RepID=UPI00131EE885|nr:MerR family transcriptional regulator [Planctomonas deserti]